jgi:hypothetical protein
MKKIITLFLVLFISSIYTVSSLKTFEIDETEKLSLGLKADDPDADVLTYTFTSPLDENGEWQTTYGDAGQYKSVITVSDGENEVSEDVLIIVKRKEAKPVIDSFSPEEESVNINEAEDIEFRVDVSDLNNDELSYRWMVNGKEVSGKNEMLFETDYNDAGKYVVKVIISDNVFNIDKRWDVNVNDVDVKGLLGQIEDVVIFETETASIKLPDFKKYGLSYEITEPFGDNKWMPNYEQAGEYTVKVKVEGKGFKGEKEVKVTVKNKDRAPEFIGLNNLQVNEGEKAVIVLEASDPDGDDIVFSARGVPENAELDRDVFTFAPGYDFVQKTSAFDYVLDRFRILSKSVNVVFVAESNELSSEKEVWIKVKDVNRPFVLESIEDVEVNEGEEIVIEPKYNDPDNDYVSFSYSGFMSGNRKKTGFDDAGSYIVKVDATDGYFTETTFFNVLVNNVNRKPVLNIADNFEVKEGDELRIELDASDPDNDAVSFFAGNLPEGAELNGNIFVWEPGYVVFNRTSEEFSVDFIVSDGVDEDVQKVNVTVLDVNQAPEIIDYSDNLIALKNEPVLFEVNAVDEDGDELSYEWSFGLFDKYENGSQHQRIFATTGSKKVEVTVSDGMETVSKVWDVEVV